MKISIEKYNELSNRALEFSGEVGRVWQDPDDHSGASYQKRFLYSMALGARKSHESYSILREEGKFTDARIVARSLLERIVNSHVASKSAQWAVELILAEINKSIKCEDELSKLDPNQSACCNEKIEKHKSDAENFKNLFPEEKLKTDWNLFERFHQAGLGLTYRSAYSFLCSYAHAGYLTAFDNDCAEKSVDFIALMAPIETAFLLHKSSDCTPNACNVGAEYGSLANEIKSTCFQTG